MADENQQAKLPPLDINAEIIGQTIAIMESTDYEWQEGDFLRRALCRERQLLQALRERDEALAEIDLQKARVTEKVEIIDHHVAELAAANRRADEAEAKLNYGWGIKSGR